jgi:hypothetical protein
MISFEMPTMSAPPSSGLEPDILKVLLYFDVFRFPLTISEIFHFLPSNSITPSHVSAALHSPFLRRKVKGEHGYFFLATATGSYAAERLEKERRAARLMRSARAMAKIIRMFPYVRGVFLSGELSKGIASKKSDIDFVVVTRERRLWIARTLLILFKKLILFNRKRFFCVNHFVTEHHLRVESRNIYTATEVATLMPLENDILFSRYMFANVWLLQYFPNWRIAERFHRSDRTGKSVVREFLELLIPDRIADRLDHWLMLKWQEVWRTRYPQLSDQERNRKYQCSSYHSTAYGEDYQESILRAFEGKLYGYQVI